MQAGERNWHLFGSGGCWHSLVRLGESVAPPAPRWVTGQLPAWRVKSSAVQMLSRQVSAVTQQRDNLQQDDWLCVDIK